MDCSSTNQQGSVCGGTFYECFRLDCTTVGMMVLEYGMLEDVRHIAPKKTPWKFVRSHNSYCGDIYHFSISIWGFSGVN